jgi:hypothetical protein
VTEKKANVVRNTYTSHRAIATRQGSWWPLNLGDLRALVGRCGDMDDDATVYMEGLSKSHVYVDRWQAKQMFVESEEKQ